MTETKTESKSIAALRGELKRIDKKLNEGAARHNARERQLYEQKADVKESIRKLLESELAVLTNGASHVTQ
jgi:predicted  nucleic acid-binding Zn-ribbon protein